jgi:hypothetical protein
VLSEAGLLSGPNLKDGACFQEVRAALLVEVDLTVFSGNFELVHEYGTPVLDRSSQDNP